MNIHTYKANVDELKQTCIICGRKITELEFNFEDYFIIFRGSTEQAVRGFGCWDCINNSIIKK